jgi:hypothetical protein
MTEMAFARIENIRSEHPVLPKKNADVVAIRQKLLEGDDTPVVVRKHPNGGFDLLAESNPRYLAHIYEDFEHIPVLIVPQNN